MCPRFFNSVFFSLLCTLIGAMGMPSSALAYKVETICESLPATASGPAQKKCKVVRVEESKAAAKGDGKGDGKGGGKGDPKKDAKPAGGH